MKALIHVGLGHGDVVLELRLEQVVPSLRDLIAFDQVGVVDKSQHDQSGRHVEPLGILELVGNVGCCRRVVGQKQSLFLEVDVVCGVAYPDDVGADAAGLLFGGQLGHDVARPCRVIVHGDVGIHLHESFLDGSQLRVLQR
ncbi:hypothetical protein SDC9_207101 [bioreactor metagenome]|uniref:Uncharacterized protein n=1 Tax=bioreactor metagenome TaxID=1076179 RepID=A0A645J8A5_9ZZZZ